MSVFPEVRWARCPRDGRLHVLEPADMILVAGRGHAEAICRHSMPAEGLALERPIWRLVLGLRHRGHV
jgi:hypothetical protein